MWEMIVQKWCLDWKIFWEMRYVSGVVLIVCAVTFVIAKVFRKQ